MSATALSQSELVAILYDHLKQTTVIIRRCETHYTQLRCNSCMHSQTFSQVESHYELLTTIPSTQQELSRVNLIYAASRVYPTARHDFILVF